MIKEERLTISTPPTRRTKKMTMMSLRLSKLRNEDKRGNHKLLRSNPCSIHDSPHLIHLRSRLLPSNIRTSQKNPTKSIAKMLNLRQVNLWITPSLPQKGQNSHRLQVTQTKSNSLNQRILNSLDLQL